MFDLKDRNLIYQCTNEEVYDQIKDGKVSFYIGIDATADSMHIGHLMSFMMAKRLELLGNKPHILIGDMTARIGDPSGKKEERKLIDGSVIDENADSLANQVKKLFGKDIVVHKNKDWLNIDLMTFLRDYGKLFNLNTMLGKDSVKSRIDSGISFTEFTYQVLQAMDFCHLAEKHDVTLQIGGQDQWGNITAGTEVARKRGVKKDLFGFTIPLLTKADGTKFGKTESGAIWLDESKTSPYEFYQYFVNVEDAEIEKLLLAFSMKPVSEIKQIINSHSQEPFKRAAQKILAEELTIFAHGDKGLKNAMAITDALFKGTVSSLDDKQVEAIAQVFGTTKSSSNNILDILIESKLASSKREAREFLTSKAIRINDLVVEEEELKAKPLAKKYLFIKRGKKKFALIEKTA